MPPLVVPNGVRLGLIWQLNGADYAVVVVHAAIPAGVNVEASVDNWAGIIGTAATAQLKNTSEGLSSTVKLDRLTARDLRQANLPEYSYPIGVTFSNPSTVLPLGVSAVVTHRTAKAGRSFRGRSYMPGWPEAASTTNGIMDTFVRTRAVAFWNDARTALASDVNVCQLAVLSQWFSTGDPPVRARRDPPVLTLITSHEVRDLTWDYQRRRAIPGI